MLFWYCDLAGGRTSVYFVGYIRICDPRRNELGLLWMTGRRRKYRRWCAPGAWKIQPWSKGRRSLWWETAWTEQNWWESLARRKDSLCWADVAGDDSVSHNYNLFVECAQSLRYSARSFATINRIMARIRSKDSLVMIRSGLFEIFCLIFDCFV